MLLHAGTRRDDSSANLDSIHNYYEKLVLESIAEISERAREDSDFYADVACVTLNRLPPRYIRYNVDMNFFLSPTELREIQDSVENAVKEAIEYVVNREEQGVGPSET